MQVLPPSISTTPCNNYQPDTPLSRKPHNNTISTMSSQDTPSIPLWHAHDGVGYKLIELPPELVDLLETENPPV